jgi:hypothetical protein
MSLVLELSITLCFFADNILLDIYEDVANGRINPEESEDH